MKIALIGYGKMGHLIHEIATERGHEVVCIIDPNITIDKAPNPTFPPKGKENESALCEADVAIEFSTPATAADNIRMAWEAGVPVVSGTTGWNLEKLRVESLEFRVVAPNGGSLKFISEGSSTKVVDTSGKVWLVWKSNFSVGVNVFFELNKELAALLAPYSQYTPSITETHHIHKLDRPSGTAVTLKEGLVESLKLRVESSRLVNEVESLEVPIESIREWEVAGIHTVTWDSEEDTITITHSAKSRRGFALGAVLAAEQLI
ncbi:MAG: 4-hydroxy-tetrahydrodipicolinate reductase [Paludibacteraceae bacterium]|nr:4-hydroxy-tetrahydrodipicolinate reductase [Paludibacteraceae bacterium]